LQTADEDSAQPGSGKTSRVLTPYQQEALQHWSDFENQLPEPVTTSEVVKLTEYLNIREHIFGLSQNQMVIWYTRSESGQWVVLGPLRYVKTGSLPAYAPLLGITKEQAKAAAERLLTLRNAGFASSHRAIYNMGAPDAALIQQADRILFPKVARPPTVVRSQADMDKVIKAQRELQAAKDVQPKPKKKKLVSKARRKARGITPSRAVRQTGPKRRKAAKATRPEKARKARKTATKAKARATVAARARTRTTTPPRRKGSYAGASLRRAKPAPKAAAAPKKTPPSSGTRKPRRAPDIETRKASVAVRKSAKGKRITATTSKQAVYVIPNPSSLLNPPRLHVPGVRNVPFLAAELRDILRNSELATPEGARGLAYVPWVSRLFARRGRGPRQFAAAVAHLSNTKAIRLAADDDRLRVMAPSDRKACPEMPCGQHAVWILASR
jgi:hypothetical protein